MSTKRSRPRLDKPKSLAAFKAWLTAAGAEVHAPKGQYELIRFHGPAGLSIIFDNQSGRPHKMTGDALAAWTAFTRGEALDLAPPPAAYVNDPERRPPAMSDAALLEHAAREPVTVAFLMERDCLPTREALSRLRGLEREGRLLRTGGAPGTAFTWRADHVG